MKETIAKLESLLGKIEASVLSASGESLREPITPGKWSRKQIIGHLIDSALNNLQRFTEIRYQPQPYHYRSYNQDELVAINRYQDVETSELLRLWLSLNRQIIRVMESTDDETLLLKIQLPDGSLTNLCFIMTDYPEHMEHHERQFNN